MPHIESASIKVLFKVGAIHEDLQENGITHVLEHMSFKGTSKRNALQIAEDIDMVGAYMNASVGYFSTIYEAKALIMDIISDMIQNSLYDEGELKKELSVIVQEIMRDEDDPDAILGHISNAIAFPEQSLGRPIGGKAENVVNFTRSDIMQYVNKFYNANNCIIAVAGNVDANFIYNLALKYFSSIIRIAPEERTLRDKSRTQQRYVGGDMRRMKTDMEQAYLNIIFSSFSYNDPRYYIQQVASIILGESGSSRLFQEVREKRGLAYSIGSWIANYSETGLFGIYATTAPDLVNELIDVSLEQILRAAQYINDDELIRAKAQVKAYQLMKLESSESRAYKLVINQAIFGRIIDNKEIIEKIEAVTKQDVLDFFNFILKNAKNHRPTFALVSDSNKFKTYDEIFAKII
jgi:predicted Zn-dependent peptidase